MIKSRTSIKFFQKTSHNILIRNKLKIKINECFVDWKLTYFFVISKKVKNMSMHRRFHIASLVHRQILIIKPTQMSPSKAIIIFRARYKKKGQEQDDHF